MHAWIGLSVARVLEICGAPFASVTFLDEPPGKLRGLEFDCRAERPVQRVVIEFKDAPELFSTARTWPEALVGRQTVTGVRESSAGPREGGP